MGFRGQPFAFDSPAAAVSGMLSRVHPPLPATERVPLHQARGRVLASPALADRDSPPFTYSAMDGYALRSTDVPTAGATLPIVGESRIGRAPPAMPATPAPPAAVRISTGAALPTGADLVVKREDVTEHAAHQAATADRSNVEAITIAGTTAAALRIGEHIRPRGENALAGSPVLAAGTILSAAALGTLAAVGITQPTVFTPLRVALITTGDELVPPDLVPGPFQLRNSNSPALAAVLASHAWINLVANLHTDDDSASFARTLADTLTHADALILTGGVSMGHRDPVRAALDTIGDTEVVFHGLPQRPGKPMLAAICTPRGRSAVPIFALPGNPVSALVACTRIALPVLAACAGVAKPPVALPVTLTNPDGKFIDLWWHRLVRISTDGQAHLSDTRSSGDIIAAGQSHGFIEVPPGTATGTPAAQARYPFYPWPT